MNSSPFQKRRLHTQLSAHLISGMCSVHPRGLSGSTVAHYSPSGPITAHHGPSGSITARYGPSQPIRAHHGPSGSIAVHHGPSRPIRVHHSPSWPITAHHGPSRPIRVHHGPSRPITPTPTASPLVSTLPESSTDSLDPMTSNLSCPRALSPL